jgi:hypothetical protein
MVIFFAAQTAFAGAVGLAATVGLGLAAPPHAVAMSVEMNANASNR